MNEQITTWTHNEELFFGIVARLFSTEFAFGAGVLLASYDDDGLDEQTSVSQMSGVVRTYCAA
ncbi:MAG: hypothetical protein QOJ92_627 [Frankiales bacterium]|nr:hypothetical protein [Frankiales bacterium]